MEKPMDLTEYSCYLEWYEASVAIHVVGLRHTESLRKGLRDKHGYAGRDVHDNLYCVLGEMAFSKICNVYYPLTVNTFKEADIGKTWQIRTVGSNKNTNLIIRKNDPIEHNYALIHIEKNKNWYKAEFKGWIKGKDARRERYLTDFGYKHRPEVYCIPFSELQPPNYFPLEAPQI